MLSVQDTIYYRIVRRQSGLVRGRRKMADYACGSIRPTSSRFPEAALPLRRLVTPLIDRYVVILAPLPQGLFRCLGFERIPSIEGFVSMQQVPEARVGASAVEYLPDFVEGVGEAGC